VVLTYGVKVRIRWTSNRGERSLGDPRKEGADPKQIATNVGEPCDRRLSRTVLREL